MKNLFLTTAALFAFTGQSQAYDDSLSQMMGAGYYPKYVPVGEFLEWDDLEQERYVRYTLTKAANVTYQHDPEKARCLESWPDKKTKITYELIGMEGEPELETKTETIEVFERLHYMPPALKTLPPDYDTSTFLLIVAGATCGAFSYQLSHAPSIIAAIEHAN